MSTDRLPELLVVACEALEAAGGELEQITDTPMPAPDALTDALRRGEVAEAVLRRVVRAAPPERRRRLGAMCREERGRHYGDNTEAMLGSYPVLPGILEEVAEAQETLRRAALTDPAVRAVMDEVLPKGWVW